MYSNLSSFKLSIEMLIKWTFDEIIPSMNSFVIGLARFVVRKHLSFPQGGNNERYFRKLGLIVGS